jgi:hypothetical protein
LKPEWILKKNHPGAEQQLAGFEPLICHSIVMGLTTMLPLLVKLEKTLRSQESFLTFSELPSLGFC